MSQGEVSHSAAPLKNEIESGELLALTDAFRLGRAREGHLAIHELKRRIC
jgi:hypothetical protein